MGKLLLTKQPSLRAPYLIAGFAGWPNGGGVSTDVVEYLKSFLAAERIGEITPEDFYVHSSPALASRPIVTIREGVVRSLQFPTNELYAWQSQDGEHDLILLLGIEPDLHWQQFAEAVLACMQTFTVQRLYTVGGYLDYAPHTRMPRISGVVTQEALLQELAPYEIELTDYEGQQVFSRICCRSAKSGTSRGSACGEVRQAIFKGRIQKSLSLYSAC
jgi:proteasome assembly chaperone (PAC2) family protein